MSRSSHLERQAKALWPAIRNTMEAWKRQARVSWLSLGAAGGVVVGVLLGQVRGLLALAVVVPFLVVSWAKWPRIAPEEKEDSS